jgi:hypothetical protein
MRIRLGYVELQNYRKEVAEMIETLKMTGKFQRPALTYVELRENGILIEIIDYTENYYLKGYDPTFYSYFFKKEDIMYEITHRLFFS